MTKEMEFFIFLLEQYAKYKRTTADKILKEWDDLQISDYIFGMYEQYHSEAMENAFSDIDSAIQRKTALRIGAMRDFIN